MIRNKSIYLIGIIVAVILVPMLIISYKNINPSVSKEEIAVEGILQSNNTGNYTYKEYVLNVSITKNKNCSITIYPYIQGLGRMSFSRNEGGSYYIPGAIGRDGFTEPIALKELVNKNFIRSDENITLVGFSFPHETGQYKGRFYLERLNTFKEISNPVLVCIYREKKFGKQLTWSKIVPITIQ